MSCAVYKYVYKGEIIYVGKSNYSVSQRISEHKKEAKFKPYIGCQIYCAKCKNPAHTTILEAYLIDKYKPILNVSMKYSEKLDISIPEPVWIDINSFIDIETKNKPLKKQPSKRSKWFHLRRCAEIEELQNRIVGAILLSRIITEHLNEILQNNYKYTIITTIPDKIAMGIFQVGVTYDTPRGWTICRISKFYKHLIQVGDFTKEEIRLELDLSDPDLIANSFCKHYKEKLKEEIQTIRLKQYSILEKLITVALPPTTDYPDEYQWIYKWILQEQTKRN